MTQYASKNISHWTEKHTKFALKNKVKHVASTLWKWILTLGKEGTEIEFNIKDFQKYVTKLQGEPFTFWYVQKKLKSLNELRIIHIDKQFGSNWYRIHLRHPSALEPKKAYTKKLTKGTNICELQGSNHSYSEQAVNSSSNSLIVDLAERTRRHEILRLCGKHGIYFDARKDTTRILFDYEIHEIESSLELFHRRGGHRKDINGRAKIGDPKAWLVDCLINSYWNEDNFGLGEFLEVMSEVFSDINDT